MSDEPGQEDRLVQRLIDEAIKNVFDLHELNPKHFRNIVEHFEGGKTLDLGDNLPAAEVLKRVDAIKGFRAHIESLANSFEPELVRGPQAEGFHASIAEFLLEALHSHNRLNRIRKTRSSTYGS